MLFHIIFISLIVIPYNCSKLNEIPHPLRKCCKYLSNHIELLKCTNSTLKTFTDENLNLIPYINNQSGPRLYIGLLSRATYEIFSYSAYSLFAQAIYASYNGYSLFPLQPDTDQIDYKYHRKIVPILNALNNSQLAYHSDYIVWMDADAIILDLNMRIEQLVSKFPSAHIFMSADTSSLANTGVMIIKNSRWSKEFLKNWLHQFTIHPDFTDQIGLQKLYETRKDFHSKIVILPPDILNSEAPSMGFQNENSRVMHLAAESNEMRATSFKIASTDICYALSEISTNDKVKEEKLCSISSSENKIGHQLSLNKNCLQKIALDVYGRTAKELLSNALINPDAIDLTYLENLRLFVSKYAFAIYYSQNESETVETVSLRKKLHRLYMYLTNKLKYSNNCLVLSKGEYLKEDSESLHFASKFLENIRLKENRTNTNSNMKNNIDGSCVNISIPASNINELMKMSSEVSYEYFQSLKSIDSLNPIVHHMIFKDQSEIRYFNRNFLIENEFIKQDISNIFELRLYVAQYIENRLKELHENINDVHKIVILYMQAALLSDIGLLYLESGKLEDALSYLKYAYDMYTDLKTNHNHYSGDKKSEYNAISLYGSALCLNKNFSAGIDMMKMSVDLETKHLGSGHYNLISKLINTALCYFEEFKYKENIERNRSKTVILNDDLLILLKGSLKYIKLASVTIDLNSDLVAYRKMKSLVDDHLMKLKSYNVI